MEDWMVSRFLLQKLAFFVYNPTGEGCDSEESALAMSFSILNFLVATVWYNKTLTVETTSNKLESIPGFSKTHAVDNHQERDGELLQGNLTHAWRLLSDTFSFILTY